MEINTLPVDKPYWVYMLECEGDWRQVPSECYAIAHVLFGHKDRWGRPEFYVWFIDPALNSTGRPWLAPLMTGEHARVADKAKRTFMPIASTNGGANYSADGGSLKEMDYSRYVAQKFISASLNGQSKAVRAISTIGIRRLNVAAINKLFA